MLSLQQKIPTPKHQQQQHTDVAEKGTGCFVNSNNNIIIVVIVSIWRERGRLTKQSTGIDSDKHVVVVVIYYYYYYYYLRCFYR